MSASPLRREKSGLCNLPRANEPCSPCFNTYGDEDGDAPDYCRPVTSIDEDENGCDSVEETDDDDDT